MQPLLNRNLPYKNLRCHNRVLIHEYGFHNLLFDYIDARPTLRNNSHWLQMQRTYISRTLLSQETTVFLLCEDVYQNLFLQQRYDVHDPNHWRNMKSSKPSSLPLLAETNFLFESFCLQL